MDKIHESLLHSPRKIVIILYNPVQQEVLNQCLWLQKNEELSFETVTVAEARRPYVDFYENIE